MIDVTQFVCIISTRVPGVLMIHSQIIVPLFQWIHTESIQLLYISVLYFFEEA